MGSATWRRGTSRPRPDGVGEVVHVHRDEAVVLEPAQNAEQGGDRDPHGDAATSLGSRRRDPLPAAERDSRGGQQQEAVAPPDPAVEDVAERDHRQLPRTRVRVQKPIHREGHGEEDGEVYGGKEHQARSGGCAECTAALRSRARTCTPAVGSAHARPGRPAVRDALRSRARPGPPDQALALSASMSAGRTLCTSPTMPRSATEKIGASWSLFTATMFFDPFMPTRCWVAPEMPHAT